MENQIANGACGSGSCGRGHCGSCGGGCAGCGALLLTQGEIDLLLCLAQIPFLPVAQTLSAGEPVYLEDGERTPEEMAPIINALHQKRLIRLDYQLPLANFDYAAYQNCRSRGSMALTAMGQRVVEQMEIQGIDME